MRLIERLLAEEDHFAGWKKQLRQNVLDKVREMMADGTTGMSIDNLMQVLRVPQNGPGGINARWTYKQNLGVIIRELAPQLQKMGFEILR